MNELDIRNRGELLVAEGHGYIIERGRCMLPSKRALMTSLQTESTISALSEIAAAMPNTEQATSHRCEGASRSPSPLPLSPSPHKTTLTIVSLTDELPEGSVPSLAQRPRPRSSPGLR